MSLDRADLLKRALAYDAQGPHAMEALHALEEEIMSHVGVERMIEARISACIEALKETDDWGGG